MKGVFPSGDELLKVVFMSVLCTLVILVVYGLFASIISSFYRSYKHTHSVEAQAAERTEKIIEDMNTMKAALQAFMAWHTGSLEDIRLGVTLFNGKTGKVVGEFTARPSESVEAHPYVVSNAHDGIATQNINIAGDYILAVMDNGKSLYVGCKLKDNKLTDSIRKRLTVKSRTHGLLGKDGKTLYHKDDEVYMLVDKYNNLNAAHNRNRKQ